jgi:hypothetical protein
MQKLKFEKQSISSLDRNEMAKLNGGNSKSSEKFKHIDGHDYCLLEEIVIKPEK